MDREILHRPALQALLTLATDEHPRRWPTRQALAKDCGFTPSVLSSAVTGQRGMSDDSLNALCHVLAEGTKTPPDIFRQALVVPAIARPGDLETVRLAAELKRLRNDIHERVDEIAAAIKDRRGD